MKEFVAISKHQELRKQKKNTNKKEYQKQYRKSEHGKKVRADWLKKHEDYYK